MTQFLCALIACVTVVFSQEVLTLEDAVKLASTNSTMVQIYNAQLRQAKAVGVSTGEIPNPTISYSSETLENNLLISEETVFSIEMPIAFLWKRWSAVESEELKVQAKEELYNHIKHELALNVKSIFNDIDYFKHRLEAFRKSEDVLNQIFQITKKRFEQGDISGYELERIQVELNAFQNEKADLESELLKKVQRLHFFTNTQGKQFTYVFSDHGNIQLKPLDDYIKQSLTSRSDIKAANLILQSREQHISTQKWNRVPEASVIFGHKTQNNDLSGTFIQFNTSVPLFNFNSGEIERSEALYDEQRYTLNQLKQTVRSEVTIAYENFVRYQTLYQSRQNSDFDLLKTIRLRYEKGDSSLIEFLDGLRSYLKSQEIFNDLKHRYHLSLFQFQNTIQFNING